MPAPDGRPGAFVTGSREILPFVLGAGFLRIFATSPILAYSAAAPRGGPIRPCPALLLVRNEHMFASRWDETLRLTSSQGSIAGRAGVIGEAYGCAARDSDRLLGSPS